MTDKEFYSVSEAAALTPNRRGGLGVIPQYIRRMLGTGALKGTHLGRGAWIIKRVDFEAWTQARQKGAK
jgi:hypothetical protein